jgi:hypothetical protein
MIVNLVPSYQMAFLKLKLIGKKLQWSSETVPLSVPEQFALRHSSWANGAWLRLEQL